MTDWDDAFDNSGYVPDAMALMEALAARSGALRDSLGAQAELGVAYGDHPREAMDIFHPAGSAKGLLVFIHGGYWMRMDRSFWSALATGALARGWAVAMPEYPLTPEVRIRDITNAITRATRLAAGRVTGPVRITGHSAGGHLATRMGCVGGPVADRLEKVTSISGLHDLRPLLNATGLNATLGLDAAEAEAESPALLVRGAAQTAAWVGAQERPELIRQSHLLGEAWADTPVTVEPDRHHFDVIFGLEEADSPLTNCVLG